MLKVTGNYTGVSDYQDKAPGSLPCEHPMDHILQLCPRSLPLPGPDTIMQVDIKSGWGKYQM